MTVNSDVAGAPVQSGRVLGPHYKWLALSNTTLGMLMATINQSIVLIALPAVFHGIGLNPLSPGNTPTRRKTCRTARQAGQNGLGRPLACPDSRISGYTTCPRARRPRHRPLGAAERIGK